jgi:hypothetical protein
MLREHYRFDIWANPHLSLAGLYSLMQARMKANVLFGLKTVGIFNMVVVCLKDILCTCCNACAYNMMGYNAPLGARTQLEW